MSRPNPRKEPRKRRQPGRAAGRLVLVELLFLIEDGADEAIKTAGAAALRRICADPADAEPDPDDDEIALAIIYAAIARYCGQ